jgi:hypothetical protein
MDSGNTNGPSKKEHTCSHLTHMHIYAHSQYTRVHVHAHTPVHKLSDMNADVCAHTSLHLCTHLCVYTVRIFHTQPHKGAYVHIHKCTCIHVLPPVLAHMHSHSCTHTVVVCVRNIFKILGCHRQGKIYCRRACHRQRASTPLRESTGILSLTQ